METGLIRPNVTKRCVEQCSLGYMIDPNDIKSCVGCTDKCPKECDGFLIDSLSAAEQFEGCTLVKGDLIISIQETGASVTTKLEQYLKNIEVITGYLKIVNSYSLITLHFFRNLREIQGQSLDRTNYSLIVLDNQNLQELFPWKPDEVRKQIKIVHGKIFFHLNHKLCMEKIRELNKYADIPPYTTDDVSKLSNGDKAACDYGKIAIWSIKVDSDMIQIGWENFANSMVDPRTLLGYYIYYREA